MLKLIKLEYKKNNISKYIRNAIFMSGIILIFLFAFVYLGIANDPDTGVPDAAVGATGVASFLLVVLMQGNIGGVTLANNVLLPVILTVISFIFAYLSVQNIEVKDI